MSTIADKLEAIEQRLNRATPGPRKAYWNEKTERFEVFGGTSGIEAIARFAHCEDRLSTKVFAEADAQLDAHAPADIAFLAKALRESLAALELIGDEAFPVVSRQTIARKALESIERLSVERGGG